ncbi:zinc finger protein 862-like [Ptychodera flava]|uniref:zinc finger protein 862-like n=1 Tax=Ptychodera flava TaxID=63121 RepID=UPI003969F642
MSLLNYFRKNQNDTSGSTHSKFDAQDEENKQAAVPSTSQDDQPSPSKKVKTGRERTFQTSWLQGRESWLRYDKSKRAMFCKICPSGTSAFTGTGCINFRIDSLRKHESSKPHRASVDRKIIESSAVPRPIVTSVMNMDKLQYERLTVLFNTAYYIAKNEKPFSDFAGLLALQEQNRVKVGNSYRNDKQAAYFISFMAEALREDLVKEITESKLYSVLNDSSTDRSTVEEEIVYVRILRDGRPVTKFLSLQPMPRGNAESIINAIDRAFCAELTIEPNQWKQNLVGMASDGASVMIGARGGVTTRVRQDVQHLVNVHCTAHRLELCLKSALKEFAMYRNIEDFLINIFKFYTNSPRNYAALRESGNATGVTVLKPGNVLGTRWIEHHKRALEALDRDWLPMTMHMQDIVTPGSDHTNDSKSKARGFLQKLTQFKFMERVFVLLDIYRVLSRLSLLFQRNDTSIESVKYGLSQAVDNLQLLAREPGQSERHFHESTVDGIFRGDIQLTDDHGRNADETSKADLISACIRQINDRFRSFDDDPILSAMRVFDPSNWPRDDLQNYGREQITILTRHFLVLLQRQEHFDEHDVLLEWTGLKSVVRDITAENPQLRYLDVWQRILRQNLHEYRSILWLVKITLLIPIHTSECERGFSLMGRIKSDWRAALNTETMSHLMRVVLDGPRMGEFDARRPIEMWYEGGQYTRRPYIEPYGPRNVNEDAGHDDH